MITRHLVWKASWKYRTRKSQSSFFFLQIVKFMNPSLTVFTQNNSILRRTVCFFTTLTLTTTQELYMALHFICMHMRKDGNVTTSFWTGMMVWLLLCELSTESCVVIANQLIHISTAELVMETCCPCIELIFYCLVSIQGEPDRPQYSVHCHSIKFAYQLTSDIVPHTFTNGQANKWENINQS